MKMLKQNSKYIVFGLLAVVAGGCAGLPGSHSSDSGKELAATGPSVIFARVEPGTIELNRDFQPTRPAEVLADVKDFNSQVTDVNLQFTNVPLEVPMENIGGSTWRARLSPRQLEMLAVSGRTTKYEARVIARDKDGKSGMSKDPVDVAVKAPDLSSSASG
jgi:hypothetical protein